LEERTLMAYDNTSIAGVWGFSCSGLIVERSVTPPDIHDIKSIPAAAVGIIHFNSTEGSCTITDTLNYSGTPIGPRTSQKGTYTVNSDGTGTITVEFPPNQVVPLSFVIVDNGNELRFIRTDGGVASCVAKRQEPLPPPPPPPLWWAWEEIRRFLKETYVRPWPPIPEPWPPWPEPDPAASPAIQDAFLGLAISQMASRISNTEAGHEIQNAALNAVSMAVETLKQSTLTRIQQGPS
jgi:hypothetical protein